MQATTLDLRRRMPEVLRALDRQGRVTILYRGKERAVLIRSGTTPDSPGKRSARTHAAFGMWADRTDLADVAAHVRTLRQGRFGAL